MSESIAMAESVELLERVRLMGEALALYNAASECWDGLRQANGASVFPTLSKAKKSIQLKRIKDKAWTRYLRRWADACDAGHQGHWFEPWIAKKETA